MVIVIDRRALPGANPCPLTRWTMQLATFGESVELPSAAAVTSPEGAIDTATVTTPGTTVGSCASPAFTHIFTRGRSCATFGASPAIVFEPDTSTVTGGSGGVVLPVRPGTGGFPVPPQFALAPQIGLLVS